MTTEVTMPRLSETMIDGKIVSWNKKPGDRINKGDILAEVETDKANMEIEAVDSGTLSEILVGEGQLAKVGEPIAVLNGKAQARPEPPEVTEASKAKPEREPAQKSKEIKVEELPEEKSRLEKIKEEPGKQKPEPEDFQYISEKKTKEEKKAEETLEHKEEYKEPEIKVLKASPLARKLARENNLEISNIEGTGPGGRITERDVQNYLNQSQKTTIPAQKPEEKIQPKAKTEPRIRIQPLSRMRQTIATRMLSSKQNIPHFYVTYEVNADKLMEFYGAAQEDIGKQLTLTDIFIKATSMNLEKHLIFNSEFKGDHISINEEINIGVAFAVENGLLVPVIHNCNKKSLQEISRATGIIKDRIKNNKIQPEDLQGGTFSISNMGMYGVKEFTAIINPPEAAGLAIGTVMEVPVVSNNKITIGNTLNLTLSADHRIVDGAEAALFLSDLKQILENPDQIEV